MLMYTMLCHACDLELPYCTEAIAERHGANHEIHEHEGLPVTRVYPCSQDGVKAEGL